MATNKRVEIVAIAKSREGKNQYTQGAKRTQVGSGYSDCSSFVRWCYLQVLGVDIGYNTAAQIVNKKLEIVDESGKKCPDEANLLPGDLMYFKGSDASRPFGVGHVEMYVSKNTCIGHGSGVGPTIKNLKAYCESRAKNGRGYIRALRVIPAATDEQVIYPANPMNELAKPAEHGIRIAEKQVNIRIGPGADFGIAKTGKLGEIYEPVDTNGWRPILLDGEVCWVSEKLSERV